VSKLRVVAVDASSGDFQLDRPSSPDSSDTCLKVWTQPRHAPTSAAKLATEIEIGKSPAFGNVFFIKFLEDLFTRQTPLRGLVEEAFASPTSACDSR
jgi:hypothetical protein